MITYYCEFGIISCGYVFYPKEESEPHLNHLAIVSKSGYEEHINLYGDGGVWGQNLWGILSNSKNSYLHHLVLQVNTCMNQLWIYNMVFTKKCRTIWDGRDIDCFDLKGLSFDWYYMCRHRFSIHC